MSGVVDPLINKTITGNPPVLEEQAARYARDLDYKCDRLLALWQETKPLFVKKGVSKPAFLRALQGLHKSTQLYGYTALHQCLDSLLDQVMKTTSENASLHQYRIEHLLRRIKLLADGQTIHSSGMETESHVLMLPPLYLLSNNEIFNDQFLRELDIFGITVRKFSELDQLIEALTEGIPGILIVALELMDEQRVQSLTEVIQHQIPLVFLAEEDSWQARIRSVRLGAEGFISTQDPADRVLDYLKVQRDMDSELTPTVMLVDDSPSFASYGAQVLEASGVDVFPVMDPLKVISLLQEQDFDLLLLDLHMPECAGNELAAVIRQYPKYQQLPIVYLSTETGLQRQLEALSVGGDDFLVKPISEAHLVSAVHQRIERFRSLKKLINLDDLTGLVNQINIKLSLETQIKQCLADERPLCLALLDIDHFKEINDGYGHLMGDVVIQALGHLLKFQVPADCLPGRYGGEEFAIIAPNTELEEAHALVEALRVRFEKIEFSCGSKRLHVTFSGGVVQCQPSMNVDQLIQSADECMYKAKASGRNKTLSE